MVLILPQGHENSKHVLSLEIGQWKCGFYSGRTDTQTDGQNHPVPYSNINMGFRNTLIQALAEW